MELESVRIDGEGPIRHLVLNRPEVHNAVNAQLVRDLHEAVRWLDADASIRVVIVRGEGKSLCSGADLNSIFESKTVCSMDSSRKACESPTP